MTKPPLPTDVRVLLGMMLVLIAPFTLTLLTVREPRPLVTDLAANPTPLGYTWSLSLFIVPVLVLAGWIVRRRENVKQRQAFWITAGLLTVAGVVLDVALGLTFFTFPNSQATLGLTFWGWSFTDGWQRVIPVEEIGFYAFGVVAVLLVYVWGDEFWFGAYNVDDGPRRVLRPRQVVSFHVSSAVFSVIAFALGWLYKRHGPHANQEGFPGYFLFLIALAMTPSLVFFPVARPFINWRAFSLAFLFILLVSLFWEAAIAIPYQWWGYQPRQMLGMAINGFSGLPVEAVLLWVGITWATVILYETILTLLSLDWRRATIQVRGPVPG